MKSKCLHSKNNFMGRSSLTRERWHGDLHFSIDKREICGQYYSSFHKRTSIICIYTSFSFCWSCLKIRDRVISWMRTKGQPCFIYIKLYITKQKIIYIYAYISIFICLSINLYLRHSAIHHFFLFLPCARRLNSRGCDSVF